MTAFDLLIVLPVVGIVIGLSLLGTSASLRMFKSQSPSGLGDPATVHFAAAPANSGYDWLICFMNEADAEYWWTRNNETLGVPPRPQTPIDMQHAGMIYKIKTGAQALEVASIAEWLAAAPDSRVSGFQSIPNAIKDDRTVALSTTKRIQSYGAYASSVIEVAETRVVVSYPKKKNVWSYTGWSSELAGSPYFEVFLPPYNSRVGPAFTLDGCNKKFPQVYSWSPDGRLMIAADGNRAWAVRVDDLANTK
ncbi:MAG: hypothetical protein ACREJO_11350 [Phycisphaerales bacterium]